MSEKAKEKLRLEIAHVLFIDIVGYSTRLTDEQQALVDQLNQVVRGSDEFQKALSHGATDENSDGRRNGAHLL
jgi:class 3 adenylate cyclase